MRSGASAQKLFAPRTHSGRATAETTAPNFASTNCEDRKPWRLAPGASPPSAALAGEMLHTRRLAASRPITIDGKPGATKARILPSRVPLKRKASAGAIALRYSITRNAIPVHAPAIPTPHSSASSKLQAVCGRRFLRCAWSAESELSSRGIGDLIGGIGGLFFSRWARLHGAFFVLCETRSTKKEYPWTFGPQPDGGAKRATSNGGTRCIFSRARRHPRLKGRRPRRRDRRETIGWRGFASGARTANRPPETCRNVQLRGLR